MHILIGESVHRFREDTVGMEQAIRNDYTRWCDRAGEDDDLRRELKEIAGSEEEIYNRFYTDLAFGTAGLRGVIGAGPNRMNLYTVRRVTQGLADYLNEGDGGRSVVIGYDPRIKSDRFAREAARVLAGNGVRVHLFPELCPTPLVSFAVRHLGCDAGIMITASHNPSQYNGYKCFGADGGQMTEAAANAVTDRTERLDYFDDILLADFDTACADGRIAPVGEELFEAYYAAVLSCALEPDLFRRVPLRVIYSPLNGAGNKPVREALRRAGVTDLTVVPEQEQPDGLFPTTPFPNPEFRQSFALAAELAKTVHPDILFATDPDSDRIGVAVPHGDDFALLSGNELGCLMLHYLLARRQQTGVLPARPVMVRSVVSSALSDRIADAYGCETRRVLTGFKYIGEIISQLADAGEGDRFILGFEESCGYLAGTYARDKDAVFAALIACEMAAYYKEQGQTLLDAMNALYRTYGYYWHQVFELYFEGAEGMTAMEEIMRRLREQPPQEIGGAAVVRITDYLRSTDTDRRSGDAAPLDLPRSNVLAFGLEGQGAVIIRPSGTEPKIKCYVTAVADSKGAAQTLAGKFAEAGRRLLNAPQTK